MRISDWSSDVCSSDLSVSRRCGDIGIDRIYRRCRAYPPIARGATRTARADWSLSRRPFFKPSDQNYACTARLNIFPIAARLFDPHFGHSVEIMTLDPQRRFARVRSPAIPPPDIGRAAWRVRGGG